MTPPDSKNTAANFASAFKNKPVEQNVKNASSWSSLAQASSPQSAAGTSMKSAARETFQAFKNKAKEKQDRVSYNFFPPNFLSIYQQRV